MEALPDDQVMESGWEELGISDERAAEIATAMVEDDSPSTGIDFYKARGRRTAARLPREERGGRHGMLLCHSLPFHTIRYHAIPGPAI